MSAKQDRQGVRTAAQLEQKVGLTKRFAEVMGIATSARNAAEESASKLDEKLTTEEIFNLLTNNGQAQGLYRGEDGELYINASYIKSGELIADLIKSGVLRSNDGATTFDLNNGFITCTDELGNVFRFFRGSVEITGTAGKVLSMHNSPTNGAAIVFWNPEDNTVIGNLTSMRNESLWLACGEISCAKINPGKMLLFSGSVASGSTFTVRGTDSFDLFAVKLGTADSTEDTVVLAYKNGNTINGVGGWAGTASLAKELFFLSVTFSGTTWTVVDARKQGIYNAGSITTGTALNVKEVVGVI